MSRSDDPDEVLRALTHATKDHQRVLTAWEAERGWPATRRIAGAVELHAQAVTGHYAAGTGTWRNKAALNAFIQWLREPARLQRLKDAFDANADSTGADSVARAIDLLSWPRSP